MTRTVSGLREVLAAAFAVAYCGTSAAHAEDFRQLSGVEIKRLVTGKVVTDDIHYTDHFKAGGTYEGVFMNKHLTGTWTVKGNQLCIIRGTQPETCDELWRSGSKLERRKPGLPQWRDIVTIRPN